MDKQVVSLLRDRSDGNTMSKTWRQIQENHSEKHFQQVDLYTQLLTDLTEDGGKQKPMASKFYYLFFYVGLIFFHQHQVESP